MPRVPGYCDRCRFYTYEPNLLICAVHPNGVEGNNCPDFLELDWGALELKEAKPEISKPIDWDAVSEAEEACGGVFAVNVEFFREKERIRQGGEIVMEPLPKDFRILPEWEDSDF